MPRHAVDNQRIIENAVVVNDIQVKTRRHKLSLEINRQIVSFEPGKLATNSLTARTARAMLKHDYPRAF